MTGKTNIDARRRFWRRVRIALRGGLAALVLVLLPAGPAAAIKNCEAALRPVIGADPESVVFKLVLDELSLAAVEGGLPQELVAQTLSVKLKDNVRKLGLELDILRVVVCLGRFPVNPNSISGDIEPFMNSDVVLEVWGFFDGDEIVLSNVVIPLAAAPHRGWPQPFYQDSFANDSALPPLRFMKRVVENSVQLRIYAAVGIASHALIKKDFDQARRFFCRASLLSQEIGPDGGDGGNLDSLIDFADGMSREVITMAIEARGQGVYDGNLGGAELPRGTPCPGGPA